MVPASRGPETIITKRDMQLAPKKEKKPSGAIKVENLANLSTEQLASIQCKRLINRMFGTERLADISLVSGSTL